MKIISIGPAHPLRGGIAKFNEALSRALISGDQDLLIYSYKFQYPDLIFPGKTQFSDDPPPSGLDIRNEIHSVNIINWRLSAEKIIREKPDLVIVHYWMPFFAPALSSILRIIRKKGIKGILLAHNLIPHESQPAAEFFTRRLLKNINGMVCLSKSVREDAHRFRPDLPVRVMPHPVYTNYGEKISRAEAVKALKLSPDYRYLLFFGLVRKYKGLDLLLHAMNEMENREGWKLIIAGEFYDDREFYDEIIDKYTLENRVVIFDYYIPDKDVNLLFSVADAVVQPYRSATQSGVTQVSHYYGVPMIVTNVGGLPEIISHGKTGYVVPPEPHWIAKAIDEFLKREDLEDMRNSVYKKKEEYSWESFAQKLIEFVKEIN